MEVSPESSLEIRPPDEAEGSTQPLVEEERPRTGSSRRNPRRATIYVTGDKHHRIKKIVEDGGEREEEEVTVLERGEKQPEATATVDVKIEQTIDKHLHNIQYNLQELVRQSSVDSSGVASGCASPLPSNTQTQQLGSQSGQQNQGNGQLVAKPGDGLALIYHAIRQELGYLRGYLQRAGVRMRGYFRERLLNDFRRLAATLLTFIARKPQKSLGQINLTGEAALLLCGEVPIPMARPPKYTLNELRHVLLRDEEVEDGVFHRYLSESTRWTSIPVRKRDDDAETLSINDFQLFNKPLSRAATNMDDLDSDFESRSLISPSTQFTERDNRVASLEAQLEALAAQMKVLINSQKSTNSPIRANAANFTTANKSTSGKAAGSNANRMQSSFTVSANSTLIISSSSEDEGKGASANDSPGSSQKNLSVTPRGAAAPPPPPPPPPALFALTSTPVRSPLKAPAPKLEKNKPDAISKRENIPPLGGDEAPSLSFLNDIKNFARSGLKKVSRSPGGTPGSSIRKKNRRSSNRSFFENALQKKFASLNVTEQEEDAEEETTNVEKESSWTDDE